MKVLVFYLCTYWASGGWVGEAYRDGIRIGGADPISSQQVCVKEYDSEEAARAFAKLLPLRETLYIVHADKHERFQVDECEKSLVPRP